MMTIRVECVLLASFIVLASDAEENWLSHGQLVVVSGSVEMYTYPFFSPTIFNFFLP